MRRPLVAALWLLLIAWASAAAARPVRVRGGSSIRAQARFLEDRSLLELRGRLADDAGVPIESAWLELSAKGGLVLSDAGACREPRATVAPLEGGLRVRSSVGGELCLRWRAPPDTGVISLSFPGDAYHGGSSLEAKFDRGAPQRLATVLRFEPRPLVLDLDKERIAISGVLDLALDTAHAGRDGLSVSLHDEGGAELAKALTGGDGKVRLQVDSARLGDPGAGKIELRFAGNDVLAEGRDEQPVTRRSTVTLALEDAVEPTDPGDTAEVSLVVAARRGVVDGGVVEALVDGASVGSGAVHQGRAVLAVPLAPKATGTLVVSVRYLPSSPYFKPGASLEIGLPVAPPSVAWRTLLTVLVLAAAAWVTVSWRRSKKPPALGKGRPLLTPGVHVVHSRRGAKSWRGTVVDAHEGTPLSGVSIVVRAPTLEQDDVLLRVDSDGRGMFAFDLDPLPDGAEIVARSETHAEERKALPAGGTLRIALITRRRALLRRFVSWAQIRGAPYDIKPEPTPKHVAEAASRDERGDVRAWAQAVEGAAFGPGEVDADVEAAVRDVEPGP